MYKRSLYYASLLYEDSCSPDYIEQLKEMHIMCLISPLHDKDIDNQGNLKKSHRHILFIFESLKSTNQVREIIDMLGFVGCEIVMSPKAYALYLTHANAPEKFQYSFDDIIALSGADIYLKNAELTTTSKHDTIAEIIRYCIAEDIDCLADIIEFSLEQKKEWFYVLSEGNSSYILANYLKSRTWRKNKDK